MGTLSSYLCCPSPQDAPIKICSCHWVDSLDIPNYSNILSPSFGIPEQTKLLYNIYIYIYIYICSQSMIQWGCMIVALVIVIWHYNYFCPRLKLYIIITFIVIIIIINLTSTTTFNCNYNKLIIIVKSISNIIFLLFSILSSQQQFNSLGSNTVARGATDRKGVPFKIIISPSISNLLQPPFGMFLKQTKIF